MSPEHNPRRELVVLLLCSALFLTANLNAITLPSLDDCFYARKGQEMQQRDAFFTVTWNGIPSFTYPSLQFWILGLSFRAFGANDAAARLPSALMAFAIVALTAWIGRRLAGAAAGTTSAALLLLSPYFLNNARRCMTEMPNAFWITCAFALLVLGLSRPRAHALVGIPLGAAVLTKSVLGLLPLPVIALGAILSAALRAAFKSPWLWIGVVTGIALGASWTIHQWLVFGARAPLEHYVSGMFAISTRPLAWWQRVFGYPVILLRDLEPVVLLALPGAWLGWRALRTKGARDAAAPARSAAVPARPADAPQAGSGLHDRDALVLLLTWALAPIALYCVSSTQSARYVFPTLPALAVLGGWWLSLKWPRVALVLRRWVTPVALVALACVFWVAPGALSRDSNAAFRNHREAIQARVPAGEPVTFLGSDYWRHANPLLWYDERYLEPMPDTSAAAALSRARARSSGLVLVTRDREQELRALAPGSSVVLEGRTWRILDISSGSTPTP